MGSSIKVSRLLHNEIETESIFTSTLKPRPKSIPRFFHQTSPFYDYEKSLWRLHGYFSCFVSSQSTIILVDSEQEQVFITFP